METVGINSNQVSSVNHSILTGHTVNYEDQSIHYIKGKVFTNLHPISERQLKRYRDEIVKTVPTQDHRLYFHDTDGTFFYSENILAKRIYGTGKKRQTQVQPVSKTVNYIDHGKQPFTPTLLNQLQGHSWTFVCGTDYKAKLEIEACVERMKAVCDELMKTFTGRSVTVFYTTEPNNNREGYHNHLVVSMTPSCEKDFTKVKKILCKAGTRKPHIQAYDPNLDHIEYMCDLIHSAYDGWGIVSNDPEAPTRYSSLPPEPVYIGKCKKHKRLIN